MNVIAPEVLAIPGVILVLITSMGLFLVQGSVWSVALLAIQYVGVFVLVSIHWPFPMALSTLVAGWIAAFILGYAIYSLLREEAGTSGSPGGERRTDGIAFAYGTTISARIFRLLAGILVVLGALSATPIVVEWVPGITLESAIGALVLIGLGLLQLSLTSHPIRVIIGLLTLISGFEIIYAVIERPALVAGLLAGVTMGLALLGVYLLFQSSMEEAV
jgi:hydrogenase-4 membrane subunit HyfE